MLSVGFILVAIFMPFFKMNILKGTLFCVVVVICELFIGQILSPYFTDIAMSAGYEIPYGSVQITNAACLPNLICTKNIEDFLAEKGVSGWSVDAIGMNMAEGYIKDASVIVSSLDLNQKDYPVPVINGISLISGINKEDTLNQILNVIQTTN